MTSIYSAGVVFTVAECLYKDGSRPSRVEWMFRIEYQPWKLGHRGKPCYEQVTE